LALIMAASAVALAEDGTDAFSAFKNGIDARALGMGGAFVAVADGSSAMYWNPAGLARMNDIRIGGMSTDLFGAGYTHQFISAAGTIADFGLGFGFERLSVPSGPFCTDSFVWSESAVMGSVAANIMDVGLIGANLKYYMASGVENTASGIGFDFGLLVDLGEMFTFGVNATDIGGSKITWTSEAVDVVTGLYKVGAAVRLLEDTLILAGDVDFAGAGMGLTHFGIEYTVIDELALRLGMTLDETLAPSDYSVGAGLKVAGLYVDAAYILDGTIGNTLVLSAEFSLGDLLGGEEGGIIGAE
jgi:hypothetical protein